TGGALALPYHFTVPVAIENTSSTCARTGREVQVHHRYALLVSSQVSRLFKPRTEREASTAHCAAIVDGWQPLTARRRISTNGRPHIHPRLPDAEQRPRPRDPAHRGRDEQEIRPLREVPGPAGQAL